MPASNAASVQARVVSSATPPEKVSHEPSEISETSRSEEPSLRYRMSTTIGARGGRLLDRLDRAPQLAGREDALEARRDPAVAVDDERPRLGRQAPARDLRAHGLAGVVVLV